MGKLYSKKKQSLGCQKISLVYIFADQGYFLFMFQVATIASSSEERQEPMMFSQCETSVQ